MRHQPFMFQNQNLQNQNFQNNNLQNKGQPPQQQQIQQIRYQQYQQAQQSPPTEYIQPQYPINNSWISWFDKKLILPNIDYAE